MRELREGNKEVDSRKSKQTIEEEEDTANNEDAVNAPIAQALDSDDEDFEDETGTEVDPKLNLNLSPKDRPNYEEHFKYLANQILHVVRIGGAQAWKHLCIGSDFDGMISPGHNCINTTEYPLLAAELPRVLNEMIKANPGIDFHVTDLKAQVKDIMFDNANEFLKKWFNPTPQV
jgi:microsomal dipeptidase-like Zn-dependent dipeptidase